LSASIRSLTFGIFLLFRRRGDSDMPLTNAAVKAAKPQEKSYKIADAGSLYLERPRLPGPSCGNVFIVFAASKNRWRWERRCRAWRLAR
jgi:hypothetical protein